MKFYTLDRIQELDCDYNFIVSGRGPGKSTAIVNMLIDSFAKDGSEFVRIGRYDWECSRILMGMWFNEVNVTHMHNLLESHVTYQAGKWLAEDDNDPDIQRVMGHLVTLNNQDTFKSASYDRVTNIVFEEFALLREQEYMVGEVEAFLSALSTIVRRRQNVKVWFIGNTLSKYNPYYEWLGIDIDRMGIKPGDCRKFRCAGYGGHGSTVAFEFADMAESDYMELSALMRVGGNVTATTGVYDVDESVKLFKERVDGLPDSAFVRVFPSVRGIYLGHGEFCDALVTKRPMFDDMRLIVLRSKDVTYNEAFQSVWLNLSDVYNPSYVPAGINELQKPIKCTNPYTLYANTTDFRQFQIMDYSSVHAYQTDEMRWKWTNFRDMYGYEKGRV